MEPREYKRIAIHSVPRSGSTWLGNIFNSHPNVAFRYQPLFSYAFKDRLSPESGLDDIKKFYQDIYASQDAFINQKEGIEKGIIPNFLKENITHICYKEVRYHHMIRNLLQQDEDLKVIGLIRNPLAVINSWLKAPKEFKKELGWKVENEWRFAPSKNLNKSEEFNGFEKWKEAALLFERLAEEYPERFYVVNYDDLLQETLVTVTKLFHFADLSITEQTLGFIQNSRSSSDKDAYSVFKDKQDDMGWQATLHEFISEAIMNDDVFIKLNQNYKWV